MDRGGGQVAAHGVNAESDTTGTVRTRTPTCFLKGGHGRCSQQPGLVKAA